VDHMALDYSIDANPIFFRTLGTAEGLLNDE
jgi:hypothetical protein